MFREAIVKELESRHAQPGETIEFSWFWFRVCQGAEGLDVETLDFKKMASFTRDFEVAEQIHSEQMQVLEEAGVEPLRCTLRHFAYVDTYYEPGESDAFLSRISAAEDDYSGWVVGTRSEGLPINNLRGHDRVSLYEICIRDKRLFPFWLLPQDWSVVFEQEQAILVPPGHSEQYFVTDDSPARSWWMFWK